MKRRTTLATLAAAMLLTAIPTAALADDVADMMEEASEAEFHGSGVMMASWGTDSAATIYDITRSAGMSMIEGPGGAMLSHGGVAAVRSGSDWYGTEIEAWAAWSVSDRYSLGESIETSRLGRPALQMTVLEDGTPRIRMILDAESRVPLSTEILDGDGAVFRMAALITFEPGTGDMPDDMPEIEVMETVHPMAASTSLPSAMAGYLRADVYDAGGGTIQTFYTDGIFSFSVFEAKRGQRPAAFDRATEFATGGNRYRRIITPTNTWVHWDAPDRSYVLVGDLPPDHLMDVLDLLPSPGQRGFLVRWWRAVFG